MNTIIKQIVNRAVKLVVGLDKVSFTMALHGTNEVCPLRLEAFLKADNFNFTHDVVGIMNHFNPNNGKFDKRFLPRFAKSSK